MGPARVVNRVGPPWATAQPIPLYFQIFNVLQSRIVSGQYPPGSLLGTEKELALEFGVSRITVQHALDALSRQGLVDRQRARGTFVSPDVRPRGSVELHGFLDDIILMGALGETREVDCHDVAASELVASRLEVNVGTRVTRVRRLRANNGELNTWIVDYVPLDVGRRFSLGQLGTESMIQLIDREPDLRLARGHQLISAQPASREVAGTFGVTVGTPILLVERDLQTASGRTVAYSRFHYLGHPQSVRVGRVGR
ncbi:MAG TPA: GntR family transcriptional regulator [Mycobacterium sp.]|nr:GntR family transcriptional regulator [Mycobacterium sp.]